MLSQGYVDGVPGVVCSDAEVTDITCVAPTNARDTGDELLVLASDGLWDVMGNKDVVDFIRQRIQDDRSNKVGEGTERGEGGDRKSVV